jgi:non-heme Fe2+,alpha-ketoglutarate-dependent halogenase
VIDVVLVPGQMSRRHVKIAHASNPNRSTQRRAGYVIRYIGAHVTQERDFLDTATLVRGTNSFGNLELEKTPAGESCPTTLPIVSGSGRLSRKTLPLPRGGTAVRAPSNKEAGNSSQQWAA